MAIINLFLLFIFPFLAIIINIFLHPESKYIFLLITLIFHFIQYFRYGIDEIIIWDKYRSYINDHSSGEKITDVLRVAIYISNISFMIITTVGLSALAFLKYYNPESIRTALHLEASDILYYMKNISLIGLIISSFLFIIWSKTKIVIKYESNLPIWKETISKMFKFTDYLQLGLSILWIIIFNLFGIHNNEVDAFIEGGIVFALIILNAFLVGTQYNNIYKHLIKKFSSQ